MRKTKISIIVVIVVSVFTISFLMGRAIALQNNDEKTVDKGESSQPKIENEEETLSASNSQKNVKEIQKANDAPLERDILPPEKLLFPAGKEILNDYSQIAVHSKTMGDWRAHTGIDYIGEKNENVLSVWDGKVSKVYEDRLWGNCVEIIHTGNLVAKYKNLSKEVLVQPGDTVKGGQPIGKIGNSASVEKEETSHLHFELWVDGVPINPSAYIY